MYINVIHKYHFIFLANISIIFSSSRLTVVESANGFAYCCWLLWISVLDNKHPMSSLPWFLLWNVFSLISLIGFCWCYFRTSCGVWIKPKDFSGRWCFSETSDIIYLWSLSIKSFCIDISSFTSVFNAILPLFWISVLNDSLSSINWCSSWI